jgi:hypothetical protein
MNKPLMLIRVLLNKIHNHCSPKNILKMKDLILVYNHVELNVSKKLIIDHKTTSSSFVLP